MDDVFVGSLMSSPVYTVRPDTAVQVVGSTMLDRGIGSAIVVDEEGRLEGILTATDFVRIVAESDDTDATVGDVMSTDLVTVTADEHIQTAANLVIEHGFHHLPVVDGETVIGVVTTTDLTAYISDRVTPTPN
ncbi:CBS domain-containing protein [Halomarina oriensis]|uniref:CBS domain-containing protein n=1 Tax=Halomarina oriensis TaxID=671145 RepID=A0A6B0GLN2_9EURY|nr:CBS domain-containing protein [Halomarina oriensis]MWG35786.1 CBS domain-containing protein [Halomarina oriensis]